MGKKTSHKEPSRAAYKSENRTEKNKARKLAKHLKKHPNDLQSLERRPANYKKGKK